MDNTAPQGNEEAPLPAPSDNQDGFLSVPEEARASSPPDLGSAALLERARSAAGMIDHDLRKGKSGVPSEPPDTPMAKFRRGVENAFIGGGSGGVTDLYVSPDGVTITRVLSGNGARCFISQLVNASPGAVISGKVSGAREVNCPTGKDIAWRRQ